MKKMHLFSYGAAAALLAIASHAHADVYNPALDYTIGLNDGDTFFVTAAPVTFNVVVPDTGGTVVGFSFIGTFFVNPQAFPGTPGQTQLTITAPDSSTYVIGGNPPSGAAWDFQSFNLSNNVTYHHGLGGDAWAGDGLPDFNLPDVAAAGTWEFSFLRVGGLPATLEWTDVAITLHSVPAPGTLALLGFGLFAPRRRRGA